MSSSRSAFFRIRVAVLLTILLGVIIYAIADVRRRSARTDWDHTLEVAIVLLRKGPLDARAAELLRGRTDALESRLTEELRRYRPGAPRPFRFRIFGPIDVATSPPHLVDDGIVALVEHALAVRRYVSDVDARAILDTSAFDTRIYMLLRDASRDSTAIIEGASEQGGRIGMVEVDLDREMTDFALTVAAHELFHTLGATDKYDSRGRTLIPNGLADPNRTPRFPQPHIEIMARNRPLSESSEVPPDSLDELAVGPLTASEIGWSR